MSLLGSIILPVDMSLYSTYIQCKEKLMRVAFDKLALAQGQKESHMFEYHPVVSAETMSGRLPRRRPSCPRLAGRGFLPCWASCTFPHNIAVQFG